ncbi:MAG: hypothetical protein EXQ53_00930 [Acidobacteria bacterium]|nr:hypothetical protein [Acidobacteriota bacterium]
MRLFLAALALIVGTTPAAAQWLDRPWPGIPRTANGKPNLTAPAPRGPDGKPDLTGAWNAGQILGRPEPSDLQPWILELARKHQQEYHRSRPYYQCRPSGPEAERYGGWKRILQTPAGIAILNDDLTYRMIHMDGRQLEAEPAPSWTGYSVGRWEGDTLVVESNGYNEKVWTSRYGVSHTDALRIIERYRRTNFGQLQVEVSYVDPGAYLKPWGFTATMGLAADTEMLEAVCERGSDHWGSLSDAATATVTVPPDVLARYVGVYKGIYGGRERTYEVSLSGGQLVASIVGPAIEGGLGAAGLDEGTPRPLVPISETVFEGLGLGYQFIVADKGMATDLVVIHISGPYKYSRQR